MRIARLMAVIGFLSLALGMVALSESRGRHYTPAELLEQSTLVFKGRVLEVETLDEYKVSFPTKAAVDQVLKGNWGHKEIKCKHKSPGKRDVIYEEEFNKPEKGQTGTFYLQAQYEYVILIGYIKETEVPVSEWKKARGNAQPTSAADSGTLCQVQDETTIEPTVLQHVDLSGLTNFWQGVAPVPTDRDPSGVLFSRYSTGFIGASSWWTKERTVGISIFSSQQAAVVAMEKRRSNVQSVILPGTNTMFAGKWWYVDGGPNCIFIAHRNTIVEVGCGWDFRCKTDILVEAATRIILEVDNISEKRGRTE